MPSSALSPFNRVIWFCLVVSAGLIIIAASLLAGILGRIDVLALVGGLLFITLIGWFFLRSRKRRPSPDSLSMNAASFGYYQAGMTIPIGVRSGERRRSEASSAAYASATATRPSINRKSLDDDTKPRKDDTRPKKPAPSVQSVQPVVHEDTRPVQVAPQPVQKSAPAARAYPDLSDPYANLFPPPKPGDEDYLEYACDDHSTPAAGVTPPQPAESQQPLESPEIADTSASTAIGIAVQPGDTERDPSPPNHLPL